MNTVYELARTGYNEIAARPERAVDVIVGVVTVAMTVVAAVYVPDMVVDKGVNLFLREVNRMTWDEVPLVMKIVIGAIIMGFLKRELRVLDIVYGLICVLSAAQLAGLLVAITSYLRCREGTTFCQFSPECRFVPECIPFNRFAGAKLSGDSLDELL